MSLIVKKKSFSSPWSYIRSVLVNLDGFKNRDGHGYDFLSDVNLANAGYPLANLD